MLHYATSLNENDTLSDIARLIVVSKRKMFDLGITVQDYEKVCNSFQELAQTVLTRLSASDPHVPLLLRMVDEIQNNRAE